MCSTVVPAGSGGGSDSASGPWPSGARRAFSTALTLGPELEASLCCIAAFGSLVAWPGGSAAGASELGVTVATFDEGVRLTRHRALHGTDGLAWGKARYRDVRDELVSLLS